MKKFAAVVLCHILFGFISSDVQADDTVIIQHVRVKEAGRILKEGDTFILQPDGRLNVPGVSIYHSPLVNHYNLISAQVHIGGRTLHLPYVCRPLQFLVQSVKTQNDSGSMVDIYVARYAGAIGDLPSYTDTMSDEDAQQECMRAANMQIQGSIIPL